MSFEICESNVFPQTPRWRPHYTGSLPQVLAQLVEYVDCCDGGLTKGARGRAIRSETFVRRCEEALAGASLVTDRLTLEFGKYGRSIAPETIAVFDAAAQHAGITIHFTREGDQHASTSGHTASSRCVARGPGAATCRWSTSFWMPRTRY